MPISIDPETDAQAWTATLSLSECFSLTLYDATYLELAHRQNLPLATRDQELRGAANSLEIKLFN